jgi:thymidylate synthase
MALPPCHAFCQFYVFIPLQNSKRAKLSCVFYQRSCDMRLGASFNIAYALLTRMIAHVTDLDPGEFIHTMDDTHVYVDHLDALKQQVQRESKTFTTLKINRKVDTIYDFKFEDFVLENYSPNSTK